MDERAKRINEAIEKSGYSYPELAKITGISKSLLKYVSLTPLNTLFKN